jgi:predicted ATPase
LLVVTFRPEFEAPWIGQPHVTALTINRLAQRDVIALIGGVVGNNLIPADIRRDIIERTDGIPLFVEEMTKAVLEAESEGEARRTAATIPSPALAVPASLQASLMARLDRLGGAKEVAQIGAAIGREFGHTLLAAVVSRPEAELGLALDRLVAAGLLFRQGVAPHATYLFKHALVQDAAYGTLLRHARAALHARIASTLKGSFTERTESQPELLAHHLTEAGLTEEAITYWSKAGRQASARFANKEAEAHLTRAIALVETLPPSRSRNELEAKLRLALAAPLTALHGYGSATVETCALRARQLCDELGDHPDRFATYRLMWNSCLMRQPAPCALALARELIALARESSDRARLAVAQRALAFSLLVTGEYSEADALFVECARLADDVPESLPFTANIQEWLPEYMVARAAV